MKHIISNGNYYIVTGGIDAKIKIWEKEPKGKII